VFNNIVTAFTVLIKLKWWDYQVVLWRS